MIKFTGYDRVRNCNMLGIGLSRGNCEKLLAGEPIEFNTGEMGMPKLTVMIMGGETELAMHQELEELGVLRGVKINEDKGALHPGRKN